MPKSSSIAGYSQYVWNYPGFPLFKNTWEKHNEALVSTKNTAELPRNVLNRGPIDLE